MVTTENECAINACDGGCELAVASFSDQRDVGVGKAKAEFAECRGGEDEIAHAQKILRAFEAADTGLVVVDGKLIEQPVIREMRRVLSIADRMVR